jgi:NAD(P)-dependent dehydrogenase (short-subunit alcohol dehydrogenase family)
MPQTSDLCVLLTGAGDSVGRVTAEKFLRHGARVHIADVREDAVKATLAANPGMGGSVCDVADRRQVGRLFEEALAAMQRIDVLVNCVGIAGPRAALEDISDEDWQTTLQTNVTGIFYTMKLAIPGMKQQRSGSIINFSSVNSRTGLPNRSAYVVSKCAVEGLTRNAARELGPFNVRCNAVLPGSINNERMNRVLRQGARDKGVSVEEFEIEALRYVAMGAKIEPEELADAVFYLASDSARHITGTLFEVSAGLGWEV